MLDPQSENCGDRACPILAAFHMRVQTHFLNLSPSDTHPGPCSFSSHALGAWPSVGCVCSNLSVLWAAQPQRLPDIPPSRASFCTIPRKASPPLSLPTTKDKSPAGGYPALLPYLKQAISGSGALTSLTEWVQEGGGQVKVTEGMWVRPQKGTGELLVSVVLQVR